MSNIQRIGTLLAVLAGISLQSFGQDAIKEALQAIEINSKELKARRELTNAQTLEANTGKFLSNPTVEYSHEWGSTSAAGSSDELVVKQQLDFPTVYTNKNRLAALKGSLYAQEDAAYRQEYLLEAHLLCIELVYLRKQHALLTEQRNNAQQMSDFFAAKMKAGDANILEVNKVEVELINAQTALRLNATAIGAAERQLQMLNGGIPLQFSAASYPVTERTYTADSIVQLVLASNPNLKSMESNVGIAKREVSLSRSLSLPKFDVGYRQNVTPGEKFRGIVVGMSIPLFENRNTVKRAKAQQRFAEVQLESTQAKLAAEIRQLYEQATQLQESAKLLREQLSQLQGVALLNKALNLGEISVTSYFVELSSFYQSQQALLDMERELNRIEATLYRFEL